MSQADGRTAVMSRHHLFRQNSALPGSYRRDRRQMVALTDRPARQQPGDLMRQPVRSPSKSNNQGTRLGIATLPDLQTPGSEQRLDPRAVAVPEVWQARALRRTFHWPSAGGQVYPRLVPDGKRLALSHYWREGGFRDIVTWIWPPAKSSYITPRPRPG